MSSPTELTHLSIRDAGGCGDDTESRMTKGMWNPMDGDHRAISLSQQTE